MKTNHFLLMAVLLLHGVSSFAQKDVELEPWIQPFTRQPAMQGRDGSILLDITNTGTDPKDCETKAKQQAVFAVLFTGYAEANNIPAAPAISPTDIALYKEKQEFFKEFLSNPSEYGNFVSDIKPNPKRPVSKIDKKTIEASNIVTVEVDRLRKAMEDQGIIKTASLFSFKPRIIVGPSKKWMDDNKYYKAIDNQGVTVRVYDFPNACMDSKIVNALQAIKSKLGSPTSPFEVVSIDKVLEDISLRDQINNAASQSSKSSSLDVFYNTLKADLWLELSLTTSSPDKGITTVFEGSLTAHDPYSMTEAIPGKPILKETKGSDMVSLTKDLINGVMNEFTPKVLEHFQKVQKSGIQGKIVYTILEEGLDDNFFTEVTFKDVDMPLAQAIDKIQKQTKQFPKVPENQTNTKTLQDYNASIFFEYEDEDMGTMEKNTFLRVANQIAVGLKKLGYITEVESTGMGRAEIKIIGKKE